MLNNDINWYVLRVRPRHEKAIALRLSNKFEVFLPVLKKTSQWSDRVKMIELPAFPGYIFLKTSMQNKYSVLGEKGVQSFLQFSGQPAIVRENEINAIRVALSYPNKMKIEDGYGYSEGEDVHITRGVFEGVDGRVIRVKNRSRLYILIQQIGKIISVEIACDSLEKKDGSVS